MSAHATVHRNPSLVIIVAAMLLDHLEDLLLNHLQPKALRHGHRAPRWESAWCLRGRLGRRKTGAEGVDKLDTSRLETLMQVDRCSMRLGHAKHALLQGLSNHSISLQAFPLEKHMNEIKLKLNELRLRSI